MDKGKIYDMMELEELVESVEKWHKDRNLIEGSTDKDQVLKLLQEMENCLIMYVKAMTSEMMLETCWLC